MAALGDDALRAKVVGGANEAGCIVIGAVSNSGWRRYRVQSAKAEPVLVVLGRARPRATRASPWLVWAECRCAYRRGAGAGSWLVSFACAGTVMVESVAAAMAVDTAWGCSAAGPVVRQRLLTAAPASCSATATWARHPELVAAVVSRGGRPDLAGDALLEVRAPVLLVAGAADRSCLRPRSTRAGLRTPPSGARPRRRRPTFSAENQRPGPERGGWGESAEHGEQPVGGHGKTTHDQQERQQQCALTQLEQQRIAGGGVVGSG